MKRVFLLFFSIFIASAAFADSAIYVQVRSSKIRTAPQLWASAVAPVTYGDKLTNVKEAGAWIEVKNSKGASGFIPTSAVTRREVVLGKIGTAKGTTPNANDVVLAGKGFNSEVEKQFAASGAVNFRAVDAMEQIRVSDSALKSFVTSGKLGGQG